LRVRLRRASSDSNGRVESVNAPHPEPREFLTGQPPSISSSPKFCPRGHALTRDNTRIEKDGRERCRTCQRIQKRAAAAKRKLEDMLAAQYTPQHAAWVARKRREAAELPLRQCDREQVTEQLEDL
jgi:hypothetical protein